MKFKNICLLSVSLVCFLLLTGCSNSSNGEKAVYETGKLNIYSDSDHQTFITDSDERYDRNKLTAAYKNAYYGTFLKITNLDNGFRTTVRVNDKDPGEGYIIKVSHAAAKELGDVRGSIKNAAVAIEFSSGPAASGNLK